MAAVGRFGWDWDDFTSNLVVCRQWASYISNSWELGIDYIEVQLLTDLFEKLLGIASDWVSFDWISYR